MPNDKFKVGDKFRIGVVAPGSRLDESIAERVGQLAQSLYPSPKVEIVFHPQCFLASGHFAGDDTARRAAFLEIANDPDFDALWFGRGGYGACRLVEGLLPKLRPEARHKAYLGYSDAGNILAALYQAGFPGVAHGPMPADILREGGEAAVSRGLAYLVERAPETLELTARRIPAVRRTPSGRVHPSAARRTAPNGRRSLRSRRR